MKDDYQTASTLTSAMYLLAMHPECLARLREEIMSKVGLTRRPTYDDIKEMKYLKAVLNGAHSRFPSLAGMLLTSVRNTAPFPCRVSNWIWPQTYFISYHNHLAPLMSGAFSGHVKDARLESRAFRENLHDTTWVSPEQGKKPLFIPQGTTYALYSII